MKKQFNDTPTDYTNSSSCLSNMKEIIIIIILIIIIISCVDTRCVEWMMVTADSL